MCSKKKIEDKISGYKKNTNVPEVKLLEEFIGYKETPVDIETFLKDDYFLGKTFNPEGRFNLFPKWLDMLWEVFPNSVTVEPYVALTGGIGIGKTTAFRVMQAYTLYRYFCIDNFAAFVGKAKSKEYRWVFCTVRLESANSFIRALYDTILDISPFFIDLRRKIGKKVWDSHVKISPASEVDHIISNDTLSILLSEINTATRVNIEGKTLAHRLMTESNNRLNSRFMKIMGLFPQLLLDSSSKDINSPMELFIRSAPFSDKLKVFRYSQWDMKPEDGYFVPNGKGRTKFYVYIGSAEVSPYIIDKEEMMSTDIPINADPDLYYVCPIETINSFKNDIEVSINDLLGLPTRGTTSFFTVEILNKALTVAKTMPDVIQVDESIDYPIQSYGNIDSLLLNIPFNQTLYIGIDIGTKKDLTGFAISYVESWEMVEINDEIIYNPRIHVPIVFGIDRAVKGQETSIRRLFNFLIYLNSKFNIGMILMDGYASVQILQDLAYKNIPSSKYSVESEQEYIVLKNLIRNGQVSVPQNDLLRAELLSLIKDPKNPNNLNHPQSGNPDIKNGVAVSKDLADALCRSVLGAYQFSREGSSGNPKKNSSQLRDLMSSLLDSTVLDYEKDRYIQEINRAFDRYDLFKSW